MDIESISATISNLTFHVPPRNGGQIVEVAYACDPDYIYERVTDRSDMSVFVVLYEHPDADDDKVPEWAPWNIVPELGDEIMTLSLEQGKWVPKFAAELERELKDGVDRWYERRSETVASFAAYCFGARGDAPGTVEVGLERSTARGITAYRWAERGDGLGTPTGPWVLTEAEAIEGAEAYAAESDETPDLDGLIEDLLEAGWFASEVTESDLRGIVADMCAYAQGTLLVARDGRRHHDVSGTSWLEGVDYVRVPATYEVEVFAAHELLAEIGGEYDRIAERADEGEP